MSSVRFSPPAELHHHRSEDPTMEVTSIPKPLRRLNIKLRVEDGSSAQSSSNLPPESFSGPSSIPNALPQQHRHQGALRDLRSLQECVQFLNHWKEQVDRLCKGTGDPGEGTSTKKGQSRSERSLEGSRKLILEWADELQHVDKLLEDGAWAAESREHEPQEDSKGDAQMRITEWAKELQEAAQSCGVASERMGRALSLLGLKKKRLVRLLPLLEFITWSLLKGDGARSVAKLWLLEKQRTWEAGISRYVPNSVWSWICGAKADVTLDPLTNHPWLQLSGDRRSVQEGHAESVLPRGPQRFDSWPCVLGWEGYTGGRRYWEVHVSNNGYWRVGVAAADSKRNGRCPMYPKQGYWVLWRSTTRFYACTKPETPLPVSLAPRRLGVYLDYEEGQLSFYNAETKSHIFTFTAHFKRKLHPLFAPMDGCTLVKVVPPHNVNPESRRA